MSQNPNKTLDEILKQREDRQAIVSTEEALEVEKQEAIWADEANQETHLFNEVEDESPTKIFEALPANHVYAKYEDIDKDLLQKDIEQIKEKLGPVSEKDFQHLLKLERWSRGATFAGFFMIYLVTALEVSIGLGAFAFWTLGIIAATLVGVGNVTRWADVTHPILHGAYDKVPNIPLKYKKKGYARGTRRYIDWLDWIKPDAWEYEHNIMHHYHLGEADDPDNVESNLQWLINFPAPYWSKKIIVYAFACVWKPVYYAPNTMRILDNKERRINKQPETTDYNYLPFSETGIKLWKDFYLPYGLFQFVAMPLLFLPLGWGAVLSALIILVMAEVYANLHSFLVIVPNHSAGDIYQFSQPHKSQGEFYLRQIMGSVNYNTGTDLIDFSHGFLNYQIEHHLFPNTPQSYQQKMQPLVKEICLKHNIEYRQDSVWKRIGMTIDLMVGKDKVLRVEGI
ncbi:fatty acid desaturase family protein [Sulfurimonas sp.]|uniref:fatty acid desaturase family protein n=1 Tax=Sulfurimonas sp. TaxID=2022749 RepID=UPI002B486020|nr:fatty acid desaturase [Sulfurimonas sp.]